MDSVHNLLVLVAGVWALGCTQVHQLGQVEGSADSATSSMTPEDSSDSSDSSTGFESGTDSSSETSGDGDGDGDGTNDETDDDGSSETAGPIPDACDIVDLGGNTGVTLEIVLMNQWDAGACHDLYVTNETPDDVIWTRDLRFGGTLDNFWNAEGEELNETDWRFGGKASADNIVVLSGNTVAFGSCMMCTP